MAIDPSTPVLIGCGQITGRADSCREPLDLAEIALERALDDCGAPGFHDGVDLIAVSRMGSGAYRNPAGALRDRRKLTNARTLVSNFGGQMAHLLVLHAADAISKGEAHAAIIAGGELGVGLRMGESTPVTDGTAPEPDPLIGDPMEEWMVRAEEAALGVTLPIQVYPMLDAAMALQHGRTMPEQMRRVANLWAGFSRAAAGNPYAMDRAVHSAEDIAAPSPANRYVYYPYTKLMNSDPFVDQACALLMCSAARAEALGVPKDRWVFPWAGAQAHSVYFSQRRDLAHAPALKRAGEALAERVGFALADAEIADLYACFPAAVELQAEALGLGLDRPLTVTGGMRFAGGPWNTYALHMVANLYLHLREAPRSRGLCCGNGGYATRFSLGVYSGSPPASGFQRIEAPFTLTPKETIALDPKPSSAVRLEAFSVGYRKDGAPERAILAGRTADDRRALAISTDAELLQALLRDEVAGLTFRCAETGEAAPV